MNYFIEIRVCIYSTICFTLTFCSFVFMSFYTRILFFWYKVFTWILKRKQPFNYQYACNTISKRIYAPALNTFLVCKNTLLAVRQTHPSTCMYFMDNPFTKQSNLRREGVWDTKTSLAYIKLQSFIELLLLWNGKLFFCDENMARQGSVVSLTSHMKCREENDQKLPFLINIFKITCLLVSKFV